MEHSAWLTGSLIYLAAAVHRRAAGALPRPRLDHRLPRRRHPDRPVGPEARHAARRTCCDFAEFGVVLMLFLVGLELEPQRLWSLRKPIFGWGSVQLFGSALLLALGAPRLRRRLARWRSSPALGLAMSSTAIGLGVLAERNVLATTVGRERSSASRCCRTSPRSRSSPCCPLLALDRGAGQRRRRLARRGQGDRHDRGDHPRRPARCCARRCAGSPSSDTPEIFTAASLLLVVATAALMNAVGLSMALGAFLAGVLLAESEYRRELETDIEPFKGLLLGPVLHRRRHEHRLRGRAAAQPFADRRRRRSASCSSRRRCCGRMARLMPIPQLERPVFIILLAQGGEFGFVVFQTAAQAGVIDGAGLVVPDRRGRDLDAADAAAAGRRRPLVDPAARPGGSTSEPSRSCSEPQDAPVIIAGFGRYGQIVGRMLFANGITADGARPRRRADRGAAPFGWRVYYGDATRLDLMRTAGADKARVLVRGDRRHRAERRVREDGRARTSPTLTIVARARNVQHYYQLYELGVTLIERETLDSALMSARSALEQLGWQPHQARNLALRFRRHNVAQLRGDRAAPQGRGAPDRRRQAGPPAARGAVRDRAPAGGRAAGARRLERHASPRRPRRRRGRATRAAARRSFDPARLLERQARAALRTASTDRRGRGCR